MGFQLPFPQLVSWISEPSTVPRAQLLWGWRIALPRRRIEPSYPCSFGSQTMDGCCFGCFNPKKPGRYSIPLRSWCCYVVVVFLRYKLNFPIKMFQSFIYIQSIISGLGKVSFHQPNLQVAVMLSIFASLYLNF